MLVSIGGPGEVIPSPWRQTAMNAQVERALEILKTSDPSALDQAIETLQTAVYSFGMKVCGNSHDAEDTAQETLIRLARSIKEFPDARAGRVAIQGGENSVPDEPAEKQVCAPPNALARRADAQPG